MVALLTPEASAMASMLVASMPRSENNPTAAVRTFWCACALLGLAIVTPPSPHGRPNSLSLPPHPHVANAMPTKFRRRLDPSEAQWRDLLFQPSPRDPAHYSHIPT